MAPTLVLTILLAPLGLLVYLAILALPGSALGQIRIQRAQRSKRGLDCPA